MNMNEFQRISAAPMLEMAKVEKVERGIMYLDDHLEEAADAYAKMDSENSHREYLHAREKLKKMLGFMLSDIAMVCDGLGERMGDIAVKNLIDLMQAKEGRE